MDHRRKRAQTRFKIRLERVRFQAGDNHEEHGNDYDYEPRYNANTSYVWPTPIVQAAAQSVDQLRGRSGDRASTKSEGRALAPPTPNSTTPATPLYGDATQMLGWVEQQDTVIINNAEVEHISNATPAFDCRDKEGSSDRWTQIANRALQVDEPPRGKK